MDYTARTVVVTGAASGIGLATAQAAAGFGAHVVALDRDAAALQRLRAQFAERRWPLLALGVDLASEAAVRDVVAQIEAAMPKIDLLVNSAGIVSRGLFESTALSEWERVLSVNLTGSFLCLQHMLPLLRAGVGRAVVNVASLAAKRVSYTGGASYTAAKAGILGLTRHAAFELAADAIRVNAVCPGPVLTAMTLDATTEASRQQVAEMVPLGEWSTPEDVASAILFLGSPLARMITGTTLDIDGGLSLVTGTSYASYRAARGA